MIGEIFHDCRRFWSAALGHVAHDANAPGRRDAATSSMTCVRQTPITQMAIGSMSQSHACNRIAPGYPKPKARQSRWYRPCSSIFLLNIPIRSSLCSRPMREALAFQRVMLERRGAQTGKADDKTLGTVFTQHLDRIEHWLTTQKHMTVLPVNYHETIANPEERRPVWYNFSICHSRLMHWPVPSTRVCIGSGAEREHGRDDPLHIILAAPHNHPHQALQCADGHQPRHAC